jgi:hypothetical protein
MQKKNFAADPHSFLLDTPRKVTIMHTEEQKKMIAGYVRQYGTTLDGLGRILMRVWPTKKLFRQIAKPEALGSNHVKETLVESR